MTYDNWKTTEPAVFEEPEDDAPTEHDMLYVEIGQLKRRIKALEAALLFYADARHRSHLMAFAKMDDGETARRALERKQ